MGTDKAMIGIDGKPMILRVAEALADAGLEPIRISVARPSDIEKYGSVLGGDLEVEWVLDGKTHAGPIDALEEALIDASLLGHGTLQLAPVDCPCVTGPMFSSLRGSLGENDSLIMPHDGERPHPLLALIRPEFILPMIDGDRRPLHVQFSETKHSVILVDPGLLRNVNSPGDLE